MILANWNIERAATPTRRKALQKRVERIAADVWVFTESHSEFDPGLPFSCTSSPGRDGVVGLDTPNDQWVAIWSRWPLQQLPVSDPIRTVAARVNPEGEPSFIIFGLVLPWGGDNWHEFPSAGGEAFREALKVQQSDWSRLRNTFPDDEFFVLGDFNQDLVELRYYGSRRNRETLSGALDECGFVALTAGAGDPIRRDSAPYACIDHICARRDSRFRAAPAIRWPDAGKPDKRLSDHFGVAVEFTR